jgi:NitT/TauT family transport system substrate-binding protein
MKKLLLHSAVFFALALMALFSVSCSKKNEKTAASELVEFRLGHLNSTAHLLAFVAQEEGFFREEGLDGQLIQFANASELSAGVEAEKLDMALIGSVSAIALQAGGHDITIIGGAMTNGHGYVIKSELVPPGFKQGDISILRGKNVATFKNGTPDYELQVLLKKFGLTPGKDVNIVYFASQTDAYNALQSKEIDATGVYSPYTSRARDEGYTVVYNCDEEEDFRDQPCCRQLVSSAVLKTNSDLFRAAERAFIKAYKFSQENHEKTVDDVNKYIPLKRELVEYEVYGGHAVSNPDPDKRATVALKEGMVELNFISNYDIEPLYNTTIYKAALDDLRKAEPGEAIYKEMQAHFELYE